MNLRKELLVININKNRDFFGKSFSTDTNFHGLNTFVIPSEIKTQSTAKKSTRFYFYFIPPFGKTRASINITRTHKKCRVVLIFDRSVAMYRIFYVKIVWFK